jgi:hypothetical protein
MTLRSAVLLVAALTGCTNGTSEGPTSASPFGALDGNAGMTSASTSGGAQVVIAFYTDAACTQQAGQRRYHTEMACFSWVANGSNAQENSASHMQCYRDRLCYTQHPNSLTCEGGFSTHKEARVGECVKEPAGRLYSRIVSGTEGCPEPPAGFTCPTSAPGGAGLR